MKKNSLTTHSTAAEAYKATTKAGVTAVKVITNGVEEYYSYRSEKEDLSPEELREDFPIALDSNQSIVEIDQLD